MKHAQTRRNTYKNFIIYAVAERQLIVNFRKQFIHLRGISVHVIQGSTGS